ncbi:MAG: hypothetical protein HFI75_12020 [Lachnospiraceae bacterium]|nr:hypothetical protein [Lachnospiraceae bacterium]
MDEYTDRQWKSHRKNKQKRVIWQYLAFSILVMLVVLCVVWLVYHMITSGKDELEGTWDIDGVTVYQFDGEGSGVLLLPSAEYRFQYNLQGQRLTIDFADQDAGDAEYEYKRKGDTLVFITGQGSHTQKITLNKLKE